MFVFGALVAIFQIIIVLIFFKYESPKYSLFVSKNEAELKKTLCKYIF